MHYLHREAAKEHWTAANAHREAAKGMETGRIAADDDLEEFAFEHSSRAYELAQEAKDKTGNIGSV